MSIASEITRLQGAKDTLKTKLNTKNDSQHQITNETIDQFGSFVDSITLNGLKFITSGEFNTSSVYSYTIDTGTEYADLVVVYHEDYAQDSSDTTTYTIFWLSMYVPMLNIVYPTVLNNATYHNIYLYGRKNSSATTPIAYGNGASTGGYYLEDGHYYFKCSRNASNLPLKTTGKYKWKAYKYSS